MIVASTIPYSRSYRCNINVDALKTKNKIICSMKVWIYKIFDFIPELQSVWVMRCLIKHKYISSQTMSINVLIFCNHKFMLNAKSLNQRVSAVYVYTGTAYNPNRMQTCMHI